MLLPDTYSPEQGASHQDTCYEIIRQREAREQKNLTEGFIGFAGLPRIYLQTQPDHNREQPKRARPDSEDNHPDTDTKIGATDTATNTYHRAGAPNIEHIMRTAAANNDNPRHATEQTPDSHNNLH